MQDGRCRLSHPKWKKHDAVLFGSHMVILLLCNSVMTTISQPVIRFLGWRTLAQFLFAYRFWWKWKAGTFSLSGWKSKRGHCDLPRWSVFFTISVAATFHDLRGGGREGVGQQYQETGASSENWSNDRCCDSVTRCLKHGVIILHCCSCQGNLSPTPLAALWWWIEEESVIPTVLNHRQTGH